jgi:hypothetical protein
MAGKKVVSTDDPGLRSIERLQECEEAEVN